MLAEALALRWDDQEFTEVRPGIFGATIDSEQLTVTVYRYEPGCVWETHQHPEDQVTFIAEGGTVDFVVDGRPTPLSPGQLAVISGNVPHSATVAEDGERVISINVWRLRSRTP
jgi:quercetin dioxygenase-like cupin family protein